jgi:hypothetical protein
MTKKIKNLKLTSKVVSVKTRCINATITPEIITDLQSLVFKSEWIHEDLLHILREEERQRKRKERQEKLKNIFDDENDGIWDV